jgi:type VI secretion system secreted protein Hcp
MALNAYLRIKAQKQGEIRGSVTQKGREGRIAVVAASHEITSPRDPASGLPTGRRLHKPFVIVKALDAASPPLYSALVNNENLPEWELQCFAASPTAKGGAGPQVLRYTVKLTNATISDIQFHLPDTRDAATSGWAEYEQISFTYRKIEWTWVAGGITAGDDWESPVAARKPAARKAAPRKTAQPASS